MSKDWRTEALTIIGGKGSFSLVAGTSSYFFPKALYTPLSHEQILPGVLQDIHWGWRVLANRISIASEYGRQLYRFEQSDNKSESLSVGSHYTHLMLGYTVVEYNSLRFSPIIESALGDISINKNTYSYFALGGGFDVSNDFILDTFKPDNNPDVLSLWFLSCHLRTSYTTQYAFGYKTWGNEMFCVRLSLGIGIQSELTNHK